MRRHIERLHRRNDAEASAALTMDVFKLRQHRNRVEAKIFSIAPHNPARIGQRRKVTKLLALEGNQVMAANSCCPLSVTQRNTFVGTRVPQ